MQRPHRLPTWLARSAEAACRTSWARSRQTTASRRGQCRHLPAATVIISQTTRTRRNRCSKMSQRRMGVRDGTSALAEERGQAQSQRCGESDTEGKGGGPAEGIERGKGACEGGRTGGGREPPPRPRRRKRPGLRPRVQPHKRRRRREYRGRGSNPRRRCWAKRRLQGRWSRLVLGGEGRLAAQHWCEPRSPEARSRDGQPLLRGRASGIEGARPSPSACE